MNTYTVTLRTSCERCAIALAGHAPALKTIRSATVTTEREDGSVVTIHSNHPRLKAHDGSLLACPEHGVIMDLGSEPPSRPGLTARCEPHGRDDAPEPGSPPVAPWDLPPDEAAIFLVNQRHERALMPRGEPRTVSGSPSAGASLGPVQQARRVDATAYALHVILDAARAERETALLVHAVASAEERDDALRSAVAASAAVDVALDALTSYVVHGFSQRRETVEADEDPLHERCRLARNAVARQVRDVFGGRPS